jgi:hypothetical protein
MVEKTTADMSMLAGEAVKINHRQTVNSLSATVHDDPSSIDFALAGLKSSAEGLISSSPNLRGTDVAKVRGELQQTGAEAIVKSAAIGYIEKTGKMPDWVKDPKYSGFVNGAELKMLEKAAQTQQKVDLLQQKQLEKYQREQQERAATAEHSKNFTDNVKFDDNGKPIINPNFFKSALDIERKYPGAGTTETRAMLNWGEAQQNKELKPVTDPAVQSDLYTRMVSTDKPTTRAEILSNAAQGKLDAHATKTLLDLNEELNQSPLKGPIWKDTMDAVKGRMIKPADPLYGDKDAIGMGNYAKFAQTFIPQYLAKQRAGTLEPNALDVNDPNSLISKNIAAINNGRSMQSDLRKAATSTAPASAAPRNDVMPAVPPPDQRPSGSIYETPRGKMKWTGTGWVQP